VPSFWFFQVQVPSALVVITVPLEAVYVHDPSGFTVAPVATSFTFERGRLSPALLSSVKPRGSFPSAASGVVAEALAAGTAGLDLNSGFEYAPGKKDTGALNSAFDIIRAYYPHDPRA